jgi:hypothetical protein
MTVQDYLLKFRKINSLESLEKLFDHLNYTLSDNQDIINMYRAADHRRAELVSGGRLFNVVKCLSPYGVTFYKKVAIRAKCYILSALQTGCTTFRADYGRVHDRNAWRTHWRLVNRPTGMAAGCLIKRITCAAALYHRTDYPSRHPDPDVAKRAEYCDVVCVVRFRDRMWYYTLWLTIAFFKRRKVCLNTTLSGC